jgi:DMSO/TMAO reductase YedYZ molybdopterin-dependent catalytic subunit
MHGPRQSVEPIFGVNRVNSMTNQTPSDDMTLTPARPRLPPHQQLVRPDAWPYVGEREPGQGPEQWSLEICGLVDSPQSFSLAQLASFPQTSRRLDIHCVTRWSKFDVLFSGVQFRELLERTGVRSAARYVSFVARSSRHHSTSLTLRDAIDLGTLICTGVDGLPLPTDHGGPVRSVVPDRYFYKSVKWLCRIELLAENRLGFWEANSGYHDHADPWREERYMAPDLDRRLARQLLQQRDFSGQPLRSIDCRGHQLDGLRAVEAILRDADFSDCSLRGADFGGANLSNARFRRADLEGTSFRKADLEGADFSQARLIGADFSGCSLFGASFFAFDQTPYAQLDASTRFDAQSLQQLTPEQRRFLESAIACR